MRIALTIALTALTLAGCATPTAPREYQDEKTAVTITAVAKPWIFTTDVTLNERNSRDYLNIHALDINRTGEHHQYLAVLQSFYTGETGDAPTLELKAGDRTLSLHATAETQQQLGITAPLQPAFAIESRWWYYPVSKEELAIAKSRNLSVALVTQGERVSYVVFRDGSAELTQLSATLR